MNKTKKEKMLGEEMNNFRLGIIGVIMPMILMIIRFFTSLCNKVVAVALDFRKVCAVFAILLLNMQLVFAFYEAEYASHDPLYASRIEPKTHDGAGNGNIVINPGTSSVGIGASPFTFTTGYKFEVGGSVRTNGLNLGEPTAATASSIDTIAGNDLLLQTVSPADIVMATGGGGVGIGTDTPGHKLEVDGSAKISENLNVSGDVNITGSVGIAGDMGVAGDLGVSGAITLSDGSVISSGADVGKWSDSVTPDAIYYTAGLVGIGVNQPEEWLHIGHSARIDTDLYLLRDDGDGTGAGVWYDNDADLRIGTFDGTSQVEKVRVDKDGNVGIGVGIPSAKLDVEVNGNVAIRAVSDTGAIIGWSHGLLDDPDAIAVYGLAGDAVGVRGETSSGIGVDGYTYNGVAVKGTSLSGSGLAGNFTGDVAVWGSLGIGIGNPLLGNPSNYRLEVKGNASINRTLYVVDEKVGIGVESPTEPLHVDGSTVINELYANTSSVGVGGAAGNDMLTVYGTLNVTGEGARILLPSGDVLASGDNLGKWEESTGVDGAVYYTDGKVGIGDSNPEAKLHVNVNTLTESPFKIEAKTQSLFGLSHRRLIDFEGWEAPRSDYQVLITLDSGRDATIYQDMDANGDDIRFYDMDENLLSYWIQDWNSPGISKIWVKLQKRSTSRIYMYYDAPGHPVASSAVATFDAFGDWKEGWKKKEVGRNNDGCVAPSADWNAVGYDDSDWKDIKNVRQDFWKGDDDTPPACGTCEDTGCTNCDVYIRKSIIATSGTASLDSIDLRSDDGHVVYVNTIEEGSSTRGCHRRNDGGASPNWYERATGTYSSIPLNKGENVVAVWCSERWGLEYCEVRDFQTTGDLYTRKEGAIPAVEDISIGPSEDASTLDETFIMVEANTGEVGIGTDSPGAKLHVAGDLIVEGSLSVGVPPGCVDLGVTTTIDTEDDVAVDVPDACIDGMCLLLAEQFDTSKVRRRVLFFYWQDDDGYYFATAPEGHTGGSDLLDNSNPQRQNGDASDDKIAHLYSNLRVFDEKGGCGASVDEFCLVDDTTDWALRLYVCGLSSGGGGAGGVAVVGEGPTPFLPVVGVGGGNVKLGFYTGNGDDVSDYQNIDVGFKPALIEFHSQYDPALEMSCALVSSGDEYYCKFTGDGIYRSGFNDNILPLENGFKIIYGNDGGWASMHYNKLDVEYTYVAFAEGGGGSSGGSLQFQSVRTIVPVSPAAGVVTSERLSCPAGFKAIACTISHTSIGDWFTYGPGYAELDGEDCVGYTQETADEIYLTAFCVAVGGGDGDSFTCPGGFTMLESQGRKLGCIQNDLQSDTKPTDQRNCQEAIADCFDTFGGRLPTYGEAYIAFTDFTLNGETREWVDGGNFFAHGGNSYYACNQISDEADGFEPTASSQYTDDFPYRCFIPATGGGSTGDGGQLEMDHVEVALTGDGDFNAMCPSGKKAISCGVDKDTGASAEDVLGCTLRQASDYDGCDFWMDVNGGTDTATGYCYCSAGGGGSGGGNLECTTVSGDTNDGSGNYQADCPSGYERTGCASSVGAMAAGAGTHRTVAVENGCKMTIANDAAGGPHEVTAICCKGGGGSSSGPGFTVVEDSCTGSACSATANCPSGTSLDHAIIHTGVSDCNFADDTAFPTTPASGIVIDNGNCQNEIFGNNLHLVFARDRTCDHYTVNSVTTAACVKAYCFPDTTGGSSGGDVKKGVETIDMDGGGAASSEASFDIVFATEGFDDFADSDYAVLLTPHRGDGGNPHVDAYVGYNSKTASGFTIELRDSAGNPQTADIAVEWVAFKELGGGSDGGLSLLSQGTLPSVAGWTCLSPSITDCTGAGCYLKTAATASTGLVHQYNGDMIYKNGFVSFEWGGNNYYTSLTDGSDAAFFSTAVLKLWDCAAIDLGGTTCTSGGEDVFSICSPTNTYSDVNYYLYKYT